MRKFMALSAVLLSACASPYAERSPFWAEMIGGVSLTRIGDDTARIQARGNAMSSPQHVENFILTRAAKEASALGYAAFDVDGGADTTLVETYVVGFAVASPTSAFAFGVPGQNAYPGGVAFVHFHNDISPAPTRYLVEGERWVPAQ